MTKQEQDKLWAELSEEKQSEYKDSYNSYLNSIKTETHKSNYEWGILEGTVKILIDMFGEHNLKPALTYEDIVKMVFPEDSDLVTVEIPTFSLQHEKKLIALNMLLTTAKFLNKNEDGSDWVLTIEDWDNINQDDFYTLGIDPADNEVHVIAVNKLRFATEIVYFRTEALAEQAVQILGESVVRTALTTEY